MQVFRREAAAPVGTGAAASSALEPHCAVVADSRLGAGDCCREHDGAGDELAGTIPELGIFRGDGDEADIGIIGAVPPGLGERRPQFADLFAVIADDGLAREGEVIGAALIDEAECDGGELFDLLHQRQGRRAGGGGERGAAILADEEVDGVRVAIDVGRERPQALALAVPGGEEREADLFSQCQALSAISAGVRCASSLAMEILLVAEGLTNGQASGCGDGGGNAAAARRMRRPMAVEPRVNNVDESGGRSFQLHT